MTAERTAPVEVRAEGRTLVGEAIRYGTVATDRPERFEAGAFAPLGEVSLNLQHDPAHVLATTADRLTLTDSAVALEVRAELREGAALSLLRRGALRGLSVEFRAISERTEGGVRVIDRAHLSGIGLVDSGSYRGRLEVRQLGLTLTAEIPTGQRLACECVGGAVCKFAEFVGEAVPRMLDRAIDRAVELVAERAGPDLIAAWGRYDRPLASVSRGTLRRNGPNGVAIDLPDDDNGRAVMAAHRSTGIVVRPHLDTERSVAVEDGDTMRYSEAHVRAMIVSATDARQGWPEPDLRPTEAPTERAALPRRRRLWL